MKLKKWLLLGRKVMTNLESILKSRDITSPTMAHLVKVIVFPVVMYGYESWTTKKAEHQRIDAFELWCWRRLLRVPWTARRFNQSILKGISSGCSLEGLMLKLKLQYFGHLMWRADLLEKTLMLGKFEGRRRRGRQRMDGISDSMDMSLGGLCELVLDREACVLQIMWAQRVGHDWVTELNWLLVSGTHWSSWLSWAQTILFFFLTWLSPSRELNRAELHKYPSVRWGTDTAQLVYIHVTFPQVLTDLFLVNWVFSLCRSCLLETRRILNM